MSRKKPETGALTEEGCEAPPFDWAALVPLFVHPVKVAIIEALLRLGKPLSSADLEKVFCSQFSLSLVSYHVKRLEKAKVLKPVGSRQRRGATETFYVLRELK